MARRTALFLLIVSLLAPHGFRASSEAVSSRPAAVTADPVLFVRTVTLANVSAPGGVAVSVPSGRIIVADRANDQVRILEASGALVQIIGSGKSGFRNGSAATAQFNDPAGVAVDRVSGDIYIADRGNHAIRRIAADGGVTTLAGNGRQGDKDGVGSSASFRQPTGIAVNPTGMILIADTGNHKVRRLDPDQRVTTIAGTGSPGDTDGAGAVSKFHAPEGLAVAGDVIYVADTKNHRVRTIRDGVVATLAGRKPGGIDGPVALAQFHEPSGIAVGHDGAIYVSDTRNHRIRSIRDGVVSTVAGTGHPGFLDVNGDPLTAEFHEPRGLAAEGAIVVGDDKNGALRVLYTDVSLGGVAPTTASSAGGETIRLSGDGFVPGATVVRIDGISVAAKYVSPTEILFTAPPHSPGIVSIEVTTPGGTAALDGVLQYTIPYTAIVVRPAGMTLAIGDQLQFAAFGVRVGGSEEPLPGAAWATSDSTIAEIAATGLLTANAPGSVTVTASFQGLSGSTNVTVANPDTPPVDGTVDAPPVSQTTITDFAEAVQFLYVGPNAVQIGVAEGTIERRRAGVVRGLALDRDAEPLHDVAVTIVNHGEYGSTATRGNGMFDLAVNGGDLLTVRYEKAGFLTVDRQVTPSWRDYTYVDDVVMVPLDSAVTSIQSNAAANQVAQGNAVIDDDGSRRAALLFRAGTTATMTLPNGTEQTLQTMSVRATEYTVGESGPKAMPAPLPDVSGYTYCVELSVDEARAAGATSVRFSTPVITYVENFLQFPVGGIVPSGYYDRARATWVGSQNGRVIKILSVSGGTATLDTNGDGAADTDTILAALGIDLAERQTLATLYPAGRTLWRVPVDHFTPWDFNWPYGPPPGATPPSEPINWRPDTRDESACGSGSIIECDNQALGETIPIVGTGMALHYRSTRVPGRTSANRVEIPLTGAGVPASLRRIELQISVAGRLLEREVQPGSDLSYTFEWDGEDIFGRRPNGQQRTSIKVSYIYDAVYYGPQTVANAFAGFGNGVTIGTIGRSEFALSKTDEVTLGAFNAKAAGLGGWTLTPHHAYDQEHGVINYGDGTQRSATDSIGTTVTTVVKKDGAIAVGGDGTVFLTQPDGIYAISPLGEMTRIAAMVAGPMAVDGIGGIYVVTAGNRVAYVSPQRAVSVVAGNGTAGFSGDNGPATAAQLNGPSSLAFHDGTLYIADLLNHRIRTVARDGIIRTLAGGGFAQNTFGFAQNARLQFPSNVTASRDGVYFSHGFFGVSNAGIYRIAPNGNMELISLGPGVQLLLSDGRGGLYVGVSGSRAIQRITKNEQRFVVGGHNLFAFVEDGDRPENTPAATTFLALGPRGELYFTDLTDGVGRVRRLTSPLPGVAEGAEVIASADGGEVYRFNDEGRHLTTEGALTGSSFYTFEYENELLAAVVDADGNRVTIERDADGTPEAIVAPGGQRTVLEVDGNGYLSSVVNPAGQTHRLTTSESGLLRGLRDPLSRLHEFTYGSDGRLESDRDPAGGEQRLSTAQLPTGQAVSLTSAEGRIRVNTSLTDQDGTDTRQETDWSGGLTTSMRRRDGGREVTTPTGLIVSTAESPDPRYQLQAPAHRVEVRTPGGLRQSLDTTRQTTIDPATSRLLRLTTTTVINGRTSQSVYDAPTQTITTTSPLGRQAIAFLGVAERLTALQIPGIAPIATGYENGLLTALAHGNRTWHFGYDGKRRVVSATDPMGRTVTYGYDDADRLTRQTFPDGRSVGFGYDSAGNITLVTPPGRPAHGFTTTPVDLVDTYTPPSVPGAGSTRYLYNRDRQLTTVIRPDQQQIILRYDGCGRLEALAAASQEISYHYDSAGRLDQLSGGAVNLSYAYDGPFVRGMTMSGAIAGRIDLAYDDDFRVIGEAVNGANIAFGYDDDGLLIAAGALSLDRQQATGLLAGTSMGQMRDTFTYNEFGEVTEYVAEHGTGALVRIDYVRDDIGRITSRTETTPSGVDRHDYSYDRAGRLTRVTRNGDVVSEYDYDENSNRIDHRFVGGSNTGSYDGQDRLLTYGATTFTYTPNGERETKTAAGITTTYEYDGFGNLTRITTPGRTIEYAVDASHRRVGKSVNGTLTRGWLYADTLRVVAEVDGTNQLVSRFVYGSRVNVPDYMVCNGVTYRIITDHLGSPRLIIDVATGTIMQALEYDEFGNVLTDTNPGFQPFGFAGGLYDPDTGVVRFGARDYDPHTGRWTTKDPIGFAGSSANLYAYVNSDPLNFIDPSGLDDITANPHNLEKLLDLFEKGGSGAKKTERSSFLTSDGDTMSCQLWPWTAANKSESWPKGKSWPDGVIAVAHTHPTEGADPKPSLGDIASADRIQLPMYTVTRSGIYKYDPAVKRTTTEEGSDWISRAAAVRREHKTQKTEKCSCSQIPR